MIKDGIAIQALEFLDEDSVSLTWATSGEISSSEWGEVRRSWVSLKKLPEHVKVNLEHALMDLLEEFSYWRREERDRVDERVHEDDN